MKKKLLYEGELTKVNQTVNIIFAVTLKHIAFDLSKII